MSLKTITLALAGTLIFASVCYFLARPEPTVSLSANEQSVASVKVNAFGFHIGMGKEEFLKAVATLKADPKDPFVKWMTVLNEDNTKVVGLGFVFTSDKFLEIAKAVAATNGGKLECEKLEDGNMICAITDKDGSTLNIVARLYVDKAGHSYGGLAIADKDHSDVKNPPKAPESEKHESGGFIDSKTNCKEPERDLDGKCVTDL